MEDVELVVLFADADAESFVTQLIERGIERGCLRSIRWQKVREPMHDARVARDPASSLGSYLGQPAARFLVIWDHHGSGREGDDAEVAEASVVAAMERAGVGRQRVAAMAFEPELEIALVPAWSRVLEILAKERGVLPVAVPADERDPKAAFAAALRAYSLRAPPQLYRELARQLSLDALKRGAALGRLSQQLVDWFGGPVEEAAPPKDGDSE